MKKFRINFHLKEILKKNNVNASMVSSKQKRILFEDPKFHQIFSKYNI